MRSVRKCCANIKVFSKRVKAASVAFGLRTGSRRLFQADVAAVAKVAAVCAESVTWYVWHIPVLFN